MPFAAPWMYLYRLTLLVKCLDRERDKIYDIAFKWNLKKKRYKSNYIHMGKQKNPH